MIDENVAVVLWSGGLFSTAVLVDLLKRGCVVYPIFVDYGQKQALAQVEACRDIMRYMRLDMQEQYHRCMPIRFFRINTVDEHSIMPLLFSLGMGAAKTLGGAPLYVGQLVDDDSVRSSVSYSNTVIPFDGMSTSAAKHTDYFTAKAFAFDAHTFSCTDPSKVEGIWNVCGTCASCYTAKVMLLKDEQ